MRIIGGKFRGRQLRAPAKLPVRPTTDQAKEALFNILANRLRFSDIRVLDLYSGTGNVTYEFASRGTPDLTSVDRHPGCVRYIKSTLAQLGVTGKVVKSDAGKFIAKTGESWDLIFMDPPYGIGGLAEQIDTIRKRGLLREEDWLVVEHPPQESYESLPGFVESRKYGSSVFSFFESGDT